MTIAFEAIKPDVRLSGVQIGQVITVSHVEPHGDNAVNLIFKDDKGVLGERILFRDDLTNISLVNQKSIFSFDADPNDFKLAFRIRGTLLFQACLLRLIFLLL